MKSPNYYLFTLIFIGLISSLTLTAQVGVGTVTPEGSLDITSDNGGLVIPRTNLTSTTDITTIANPRGGGPVEGTIIYDLGANITEGFYVYNGTLWEDLRTTDTDTYLAMSDQTLTGARTVNLNGNVLNFNIHNNGSDRLSLDTDYLTLGRNPSWVNNGMLTTRGGMNFIIDSNDNNHNDNKYYSWGEDGSYLTGTGDAAYNELMRLDGTGLGVGTNNPGVKLHVVETTGNINVAKFQSPEFPMFAGFIIEDTGGSNTARFAITPGNVANNSSGALAGVPAGNANGRNSVTFDVEGSTYDIYTFMEGTIRPGFDNLTSLGAANHRFTDIFLVNNPTVTSDIRLKDNIVETNYGLDTVMQITPVSYQLISDENNEVHLGFKAQEIQELIPEIVNTAEESGMLSMAYAEMIPVLTKAIQELNEKLDVVIEENASLRAQNNELLSSTSTRE